MQRFEWKGTASFENHESLMETADMCFHQSQTKKKSQDYRIQ